MQKRITAVVLLGLTTVFVGLMLTCYVVNIVDPLITRPHREGLYLKNQGIAENPTFLNVSFSIGSVSKAVPINKLIIDNTALSEVSGVLVNVNGTVVDSALVPLFVVEPRDETMVSVIVPYVGNPYALSRLYDQGYITLTALTPQAMYYKEIHPINI